MKEPPAPSSRKAPQRSLLRWLSHALFALFATSMLLVCVEVCYGVWESLGTEFLGFYVTESGNVNPTSARVWGGERAGIRRWDKVVAVDGVPVHTSAEIHRAALRGPLGRQVTYQMRALDGTEHFVQMKTRLFTASDVARSQASQAFLGLLCVLIAVLLYGIRPATLEAWSFFAFFGSIGVCMASVVDLTMQWRLPPIFPYVIPYTTVFGFILIGAITKSFSERAVISDPEGRILQRLLIVFIVVATLISTAVAYALHRGQGDMRVSQQANVFLYTWLAAAICAGVTVLIIAYRRGRSPHRRARIRQILWAWPVGAGIPTLNLFMGHVLELPTMSFLWNGFIILMPLSTADAIVRHDLLHLNATARRLVGGMAIAAMMGTALGIVLWAAARFLDVNDAPAMIALAALLFAVAAPITHRVQAYVENLLRSHSYESAPLLAEFTGRASTATHLGDLMERLADTLSASLKPLSFELYRVDKGEFLQPLIGSRDPLPIAQVADLLERTSPVVFDPDELPAPSCLAGAAIALRLAVQNEPVGLLVLAPHRESFPYEGADIAFVSSLAGPLAAALVSTLAYQEVESLVHERTAELEAKNIELNTLDQRKDELVATISHDFRSPLAIIRQNVQTILRDMGRMDDEDMRDFLEGVARQENRLTSMCTNLLDLARLKQATPQVSDVDMAALARSLVEAFAQKAEQKGVTLSLQVDDDAPVHVQGESDRLEQVFQNLVDNAIKFTPAGGEATVHLRAIDSQRLLVEVKDTGCGIPEDATERLFEPFFQVPRQSHVGQGSGLGLAIVKAVVEAHGGEASVRSEVDQGTSFLIELPASLQPASPASAEGAHDDEGAPASKRSGGLSKLKRASVGPA